MAFTVSKKRVLQNKTKIQATANAEGRVGLLNPAAFAPTY